MCKLAQGGESLIAGTWMVVVFDNFSEAVSSPATLGLSLQ
jgi:hypothetical protein